MKWIIDPPSGDNYDGYRDDTEANGESASEIPKEYWLKYDAILNVTLRYVDSASNESETLDAYTENKTYTLKEDNILNNVATYQALADEILRDFGFQTHYINGLDTLSVWFPSLGNWFGDWRSMVASADYTGLFYAGLYRYTAEIVNEGDPIYEGYVVNILIDVSKIE
jgi:hypothetical protein